MEQALAAKTFGDLALVLHDLPTIEVATPTQTEAASPVRDRAAHREERRMRHRERHRHRRYGRRGLRAHATSYVMMMGLLLTIWLLTSPGHYFWPIWPMLGWGFGLIAHALSALSQRREELPPAYGAQ